MRRILSLSMLCLSAGILSACRPDEVIDSPVGPKAGVRFINAVPDTGGANGLDFRFIDYVENTASYGVQFRNNPQTSGGVTGAAGVQFKPARTGARHFRVFLSDTLQTIATQILVDSTVTLEEGHNYTFLLWGNARSSGADRMRMTVIDENVADPGSNVALRVINTTGQAIDARQYTGTTVPAAATWSNIAPYSISNYVTVPPAQIRFDIQPAGGGAAIISNALALIGQPVGTSTAGCTVGLDCDVVPGTTVPGSAVTLIVFPRSVPGTRTPQGAAYTVPGHAFVWDRRPARQCTVSFGC